MKTTIEMAREVGIIDHRDAFSDGHVQAVLQDLKAFESLVRADEREACAKVCENIYTNGDGAECWLENAAEKIRNRGNT
jgi:hypothetical protein